MKKREICARIVLIAFFFIMPGIDAWADFKVTQWAYYREIDTTQMKEAKNYRLVLDGPVYGASQVSLSDLRLMINEQFETPYEIVTVRGRSEIKNMASAILENIRGADNSNIIIFDLGAQVRPNNKITLEITERNFGKKVTIEGSNDRSSWIVLTKDVYIYDFSFGGEPARRSGEIKWKQTVNSKYMVDFSYNASSRDTSISYPESNFRYIRASLFGIKDEDPITVTAANITSHYAVPAEEALYSCVIQENKVDVQAKTTQAILDFGAQNLPIERVKIECDGFNYYRTVYVQGSNDFTDWFTLGSGEVFDYNVENFKDAKKEIKFPEARCRYVKLTIMNQDNVPINVVSATGYGLKRYLIFPFQKTGSLRLYYGNQRAPMPVYDYARFIGKADFATMPFVRMAKESSNASYAPEKIKRPWTEEHPYFLWVAVIGIVIILLFLVASMIKTVRSG